MINKKRSPFRGAFIAAALWLLLLSEMGLAGSVEVTDAWVRATMPGQTVAGVYLHVKSMLRARVVGVKTGSAKTAEIHSMSQENGVMKMRKLDFLDLPPGETVALEPRGNHVMLFDIHKPLQAGERIKLTLVIEQEGKKINVPVTAEVRALTEQH
jgi:copper(I)-binding protein